MFVIKEFNNWIIIDLQNGQFYSTQDNHFTPYDSITIGDKLQPTIPDDILKIISKKYNFLQYCGSIQSTKYTNNRKIYGIIDYISKIQYGKDSNNKFISIFRPLSFSSPKGFLIKTKNRQPHNVYALAEITDEKNNDFTIVKCIDIYGPTGNKSLDILSPFHSFNVIPKKYKKPISYLPNSFEKIINLTDKNVFSIDGDTTLDVDDAIHYDFDTEKNVHIIGIHIADVASMFLNSIKTNEQSDFLNLLLENTSSIYPDGKIDMISKEIGEEICSLKQDETRNVISLLLEFEQKKPFKLTSSKIHLSTVINKHKLTYKYADKILRGQITNKTISDSLYIMKDIIDLQENFPVMNDNQFEDEYLDEKISRSLVGKLMTLYNMIFAKKLFDTNKKSIVRVHYGKVKNVTDVPDGLICAMERMETFKGYYRVCEYCEESEIRHEGLGLKFYTHATSPIRRFVDLWNQLCLYETLYPGLNVTSIINIKEKIHEINWKQMMIKKAYDQLNLVKIYYDRIEGKMDELYDGFVIDIDDDEVGVYFEKLGGKIFRFKINNMEKLFEIISTDDNIVYKRNDGKTLILHKYMKIKCKIIVKKNKYSWNQKVDIELIEPSFSNFLLT